MNPNLLDLDAARLASFFAGIGEKPFRAKQLLRWMHQFGESDFSKMSDLAKALRSFDAFASAAARSAASTASLNRPC